MTDDARFEDGREGPLNLGAEDADDLHVISSLCQDAVFPITEMQWRAQERRFALLLNRFRWEDEGKTRHTPERVRTVLAIDNVLGVSSHGIDRADKDVILSLLSISFEAGEDAAGQIHLTLAGDGAIRLNVEALDATLKDVTKPYTAVSKSIPKHDLD
ncbi:MAG: DUF2948 family protein [Paracoccaceae bacterium]